jgi:hypothetical protein
MTPPATSDSTNIKFLLAIIDSLGGTSGVKWGEINEKMGGEKTNSALRKTFVRIKEKNDKEQGAGAGAGNTDGFSVKPAAAKTKSPAKKCKVEVKDEVEDEDVEDGAE